MPLWYKFKERSCRDSPSFLQKWEKMQMCERRFALLGHLQLPWRVRGKQVWRFTKTAKKEKWQEETKALVTKDRNMLQKQRIFGPDDGRHKIGKS